MLTNHISPDRRGQCSYVLFRTESLTHPKYFFDKRKTPCSLQHPGESHGVCDGFGKCLCAPPFIGADCSIRDCEQNCSGHGDCSVEYPNSRCLCDVGWTGKVCDYQLCVNNCSYPNGVCVNGCTLSALAVESGRSVNLTVDTAFRWPAGAKITAVIDGATTALSVSLNGQACGSFGAAELKRAFVEGIQLYSADPPRGQVLYTL